MNATRVAACLLAVAVGLAAAPARADDPIAAEATFAKGRALMKAGHYAEACSQFELSLSLERAAGTQVNLAECYAKVGRTASAWLAYREAASLAQQAGQAPRAAEARERAAKLEPTLCRLVVRARGDAPAEMSIQRDGKVVDRLLWGVAVPVDAGPHRVDASLPGAANVTRTVEVPPATGEACPDTVIELPALRATTPPPAPIERIAPLATAAPAPPAPSLADGSAPRGRTQRFVAVGLGGLGLAALGVGSGFAVDALSKKNAAACTDAGCTPDGRLEMRAGGRSADVTTVAVTAGVVLLVAGTVVWLTAPSPSKPDTAFRF